jgi:hypothetical protein
MPYYIVLIINLPVQVPDVADPVITIFEPDIIVVNVTPDVLPKSTVDTSLCIVELPDHIDINCPILLLDPLRITYSVNSASYEAVGML